MIEHQPANHKSCFLSEAKLFSFIVGLNKIILAAFIARLRHLGKTKLNGETTMYCSPDSSNFLETPCIYLLQRRLSCN